MIYNQFIKTFTITALNTQCSAGSDAFYLQGLFARFCRYDEHRRPPREQRHTPNRKNKKQQQKKLRGLKKGGGGERKEKGEKDPCGTVWQRVISKPKKYHSEELWWRDGRQKPDEVTGFYLIGPTGRARSHKSEWTHRRTWKLSTQVRKSATIEVLWFLP